MPEKEEPSGREFRAAGSGVIVDSVQGFVITNDHVIQNAEEITVLLDDGRRLEAKRIGTDPATDIAVIQVEADHLTAVPFGDSSQLRVGDYVVAIGNPFGLDQTVTMGIVSALGRSGLNLEGYEDFIQTDASINPGNSGGALINLKGELVGINSAIIGPSGGNIGIGFAIPVNMARTVMGELIAHGKVERGHLGILVQDLTQDLAKTLNLDMSKGAVVSQVVAGSPAEKAGIKAGDVITDINGEPVAGASALRNKIGLMRIGSEVRISLIRKGTRQQATAFLAKPVARLVVPKDVSLLASVVLAPAEPTTGTGIAGAVVVEVGKNSPAHKAGLAVGDMIVGINQEPTRSPEEVVAFAKQYSDRLLLQVIRNGKMRLITIS